MQVEVQNIEVAPSSLAREKWLTVDLLKELAICFSTANLLLLPIIDRVQNSTSYYYIRSASAGLEAYLLNVLAIGGVGWIFLRLIRRAKSPILVRTAWAIFTIILLIALNGARMVIPGLGLPAAITTTRLALAAAIVVPTLLFLCFRFRGSLVRVLTTALLFAFPLFPVNALVATWIVVRTGTEARLADRPTAPLLNTHAKSPARVVVLVFDELDQRMVFVNRPPGVELPQLERFRDESLYATAAHRAGRGTMISMPALITGRPVQRVGVVPNELFLTFRGETKAVPWSAQPNLFSRARALGANTGLVGWQHPYCRILSDSLTTCAWAPGYQYLEAASDHVGQNMLDQIFNLSDTLPMFGRLGVRFSHPGERVDILAAYLAVRKAAFELIDDSRIQLAFLHWPVPHPPGYYDRVTHQISRTGRSDYLDNLALADQTLGDLREAMEKSHTWDDSIILLTADHNYRTEEWRDFRGLSKDEQAATGGKSVVLVPFMLKLPGQKHPIVYGSEFSTILLNNLVLTLLDGKLTAPEDVVHWLDANRTAIPLD